MLKKDCPLCHEKVPLSFFERHVFRERSMIRRMKEDHPEWLESDGACLKCLDEYKKVHDQLLQEVRLLRQAHGESYETIDEDFEKEYDEYAARQVFMNFELERKEEEGDEKET